MKVLLAPCYGDVVHHDSFSLFLQVTDYKVGNQYDTLLFIAT